MENEAYSEHSSAIAPHDKPSGKNVQLDIQTELSLRKQEYDEVIRTAQRRGLLGGALQGGLVGLLITGAPEGAIVGSVAGSAFGYWISGKAATNIVEEHRNFLIRKWSIETVMKAAIMDTENTRFDLLLSERALKATRSAPQETTTLTDQGITHLLEFRERAEGRAMVLHEVIPVFAGDRDSVEQLSALLKKQVTMLEEMRTNIDEIANSHD